MFTSGGRDISSSSYGPYWRLLRRNLAGEALSPARVGLFAPARRWACDGLVSSLLSEQQSQRQDAVTLRPLLRRAMFELLVYMCFGARLGRETLDEVEELQHQALLSVTTFPVFAFFPAVTKRLFGRRWAACLAVRRRQDEVFVPLIHAKRGDGDPPCYADSLLAVRVADEGGRQLTDAEMVALCSEFMNGGTDTTVTLLEWIVAELVQHPDVQTKVYEEVKANPELNNLQAMPYLKAVVLEGLRLHPPGHFVLPHGVQSGDAEIAAYAVPKGAEVNFLVAEIGRDETVWTAAREFRPERFLEGGEGHGVDITGSREIKMMPFGAGRRMCPGYTLGMHHAEYFVARMVREMERREGGERGGGAGRRMCPGVHAGHAPRRVLRGENGEGAGVAAGSGGGEGGHGGDARFPHRDEAPAPCAHRLQKLTISHPECNLSTYESKNTSTQLFYGV
uniref:Cytochrome P450 89A2 n=1 Tax=Aegilops tauschii TaxID=37682 RepID=R7W7N0_AEGTA